MRADRLVATLLLLQARGRITAADVAAELEVSLKTARRDLEALSMAGIPVYSQAGRGGGWSLLGGGRTDLSGLTAAEARALFLVAGPSVTLAPEAKAALRKLIQALPTTFRADAAAAATAVVIDPMRWGDVAPPSPSRHLHTLQRAVVDGVQARVGYADRTRKETERTVHPLGLVEKRGAWYLVADTDAGLRTFRVSRIRSVAVTDAPVIRPPGFELGAAWESTVASVEEQLSGASADVRIPAGALPWLRGTFGRALSVGASTPDGRVAAQVRGRSAEHIAQLIAGWGKDLEVIGPDEVRAHLARIGAELVAQHGGAGS